MCYRENSVNFIEGCDRDITSTCTEEVFTNNKLLLASYCFQPVSKVSRVQLNLSTTTYSKKNTPYLLIHLSAASTGSWVDVYFVVCDTQPNREMQFIITNTSIIPRHINLHKHNLLAINCTKNVPQTFRLSAFSLTMIDHNSQCYEHRSLIQSTLSHGILQTFPACQLFSTGFGTNSAEEMDVISMKGEIKKVMVNNEYSQQHHFNNFCFNIFWLEDTAIEMYNREDLFQLPQECKPRVTKRYGCSGFSYCLNFTGVFSYIFLRESCPFYFVNPKLQAYTSYSLWPEITTWKGLKSWREARDMCRFYRGLLPVLRSYQELQELIAFIKKSEYMPILEAIYIGLLRNTSQKASALCISCCAYSEKVDR